ncbi:MAG: conjugal transfer protein TrbE, partial [Pseudomonadota bacterium]
MLNLSEYCKRPARLADLLPWAALVAPGIILNKDGSFQRTLRFRGPDLDSATPQEMIATCARINNALRRLGSGWALHIEAVRRESDGYSPSEFVDPLAGLIEQERHGLHEASGTLFESDYFLTLTWLPPVDKVGKAERLFVADTHRDNTGETEVQETALTANSHLTRFLKDSDAVLALLSDVFPVAILLSDGETLTYLQSCLTPQLRNPIRAPDIPMHLDAILGGIDLVGGLA